MKVAIISSLKKAMPNLMLYIPKNISELLINNNDIFYESAKEFAFTYNIKFTEYSYSNTKVYKPLLMDADTIIIFWDRKSITMQKSILYSLKLNKDVQIYLEENADVLED